MKKVLSTVAAIGLVAGFAATASAGYMDFSVTGYYQVDGKMLSDASTSAGGVQFTDVVAPAESYTKAWMEHDFRIYPVLKVNDNITMKADVRALSDTLFDDVTTGGGRVADQNDITASRLWMEYMAPIGMFKVGLMPSGAWGSPFFNNLSSANRVVFTPNMISDPWSFTVFYEKNTEGTAVNAATTAGDLDNTSYYAGVGYKMEGAKFDLAYWGVKDGTVGAANGAGNILNSNIWFNAEGAFGPVNYVSEVIHSFGDATATTDMDATAAMVLLSGKVSDQLTIGGVYFMATGNDANSTDNEQMMGATTGTGVDWEPLYIMTGDDMGVLNGDTVAANAAIRTAGVEAFGIFADFGLSPKTTLHAAVGTGQANETNNMPAGTDDDYGWEADLGVSHKLLDNLTYELHFGYWAVGDFVKGGVAATNPAEVTLLTNHLIMKF